MVVLGLQSLALAHIRKEICEGTLLLIYPRLSALNPRSQSVKTTARETWVSQLLYCPQVLGIECLVDFDSSQWP